MLQVSSGNLHADDPSPLTVKTGPATQLVITSQPPTGVDIGDPFGIAIVAEDAYGNVATSFNGTVTVAIAGGAGDGALAGTLNVAAVQGVASFTGLTLDIVGSGYALQATSSGLTAATTTHVTVSLGPVPHLVLLSPPSAVTVGQYFQVTVIAEDSTGAIETSYTGEVTLAMASDPGGATLGGNLTMPVTDGKVTFYGLTLNVTGSGYAIRATGSGFSPAVTAPITVVDPPATQLVVAAQPPSIVTGESALRPHRRRRGRVRCPGLRIPGERDHCLVRQASQGKSSRHAHRRGDRRRSHLQGLDADQAGQGLYDQGDRERARIHDHDSFQPFPRRPASGRRRPFSSFPGKEDEIRFMTISRSYNHNHGL